MSDFLANLGIDPEEVTWQHLGLCRGLVTEADEDIFYDRYEKDEETARQADQMCLVCPVISQCFFAGADGQQGVWGGVYWNGSGKPDKNKNSHKTEETWAQIHQRVRETHADD